MAATLTIRETSSGLYVHAQKKRSYTRLALVLFVGSLTTYIFLRPNPELKVPGFFGALIAIGLAKDLLSTLRGTDVTLDVGNLDFRSSGHAPGGYNPSVVSRADIHGLVYRKASGGGGKSAEYPQGLYAEYGNGAWNHGSCLLPDLNEAQVNEAIEAILRRFPDTGTLATPGGPFRSDLTSLNLNRP